MAEFVCKVGDTSGRIFQQVETAQSEDEARQKLADRGFYVFSVRSHFDLLAQFGRSSRDRKIHPHDFLIFNQQFNTLVKAGLPILRALDLLAERAAAARIRPILEEVRQRVRDGALLSEAMAAQGSFPPVYVTVIAAGERSGNLTGVLEQYISYLRVSTGFRSRLITSLIYPSVLVLTAVLVVTYVVTYALPQFAGLYHELNVPLPTRTRILLAIALPLRTTFRLDRYARGRRDFSFLDAVRSRRDRDRSLQTADPDFRRYLAEGADRAVRANALDAAGRRHAAGAGAAHVRGGHRQPADLHFRRAGGGPREGRAVSPYEPCGNAADSRPGAGDDRGRRSLRRAPCHAHQRGGVLRRGSRYAPAAHAFLDPDRDFGGHGRCDRLHFDLAVSAMFSLQVR